MAVFSFSPSRAKLPWILEVRDEIGIFLLLVGRFRNSLLISVSVLPSSVSILAKIKAYPGFFLGSTLNKYYPVAAVC